MLHNRSFRRIVGFIALLAMTLGVLIGVFAAIANAAPPLQVDVRSAILMDYSTGQVLLEQEADLPIPPASLTKLMTLHLAQERIEQGSMSREDKVQISRDAWAATMPGSSVMFLEPGQNVTVGEIMKGIAVPSGNDASVAIAQHMAGTVEAFVALMNQEAKAMGYQTMHFADPAGLSPQNMVTAREFADFVRRYIQLHPDALTELHSVKEYTYPLPANLPQHTDSVTQFNRNSLLWTFDGVDGLKTGFIEESGYNIALTAQREEMRLIAIILGAPGRNTAEGTENREQAGAALLQWGFANFLTIHPPTPTLTPLRVYKGAVNELSLEPAHPVVLTVERGQEESLTSTVQQEPTVVAPVQKGQKLGELIFAADGKEVSRMDLVATADVAVGGFFKRLWDSVRLLVAGWVNRKG